MAPIFTCSGLREQLSVLIGDRGIRLDPFGEITLEHGKALIIPGRLDHMTQTRVALHLDYGIGGYR